MGRAVICAAIFLAIYLVGFVLVQYVDLWGGLFPLEVWHGA